MDIDERLIFGEFCRIGKHYQRPSLGNTVEKLQNRRWPNFRRKSKTPKTKIKLGYLNLQMRQDLHL